MVLFGSVGEQEEVSEHGLAARTSRKKSPGQRVTGVRRLGHVACSYGPAALGFLIYKT